MSLSTRARAIASALVKCGCMEAVVEPVAKSIDDNIGERKAADCEGEIVMALTRIVIISTSEDMPQIEFDRTTGRVAKEIITEADRHSYEVSS